MLIGAAIFATDYAIRPDDLARELEQRGFESIWLPEHTHIPVSRRTPYPAGGDLPKEYWHTHDPFVALTAAAIVTTKLRVATGICLIIERDTIITAKEVASLDVLSGGRFIFGIGGGWNAEEMENHGTNPATRWRLLREQVLAMKEIWTKDEAEYHGEFVNFDPIWSWPKPAQKPHPPVLMGGDGPRAEAGLLEYCEEWLPRPGRSDRPFEERVADVNRRAAQAGRGPIPMTIFGAPPDPKAIESFEAIGAKRCLLRL